MSNMRMKTPRNIEELKQCLREADDKIILLGGGTDLMIHIRKNRIYEGTLLDLKGVNELRGIQLQGSQIHIGANTTFTEMVHHDLLQAHGLCLVEAAARIGSTQIRNVATIGGNVANAFPGADAIPALMALDASIEVMNGNGEVYEKPLEEIILGQRRTSLKSGEVIAGITLPMRNESYKSAFEKIGSRSTVTIAKLNAAILVKVSEQEACIKEAKVVLGALGPKAFASEIAGKVLLEQRVSKELEQEFAQELMNQVDLAIPGRASQAYKREAVRGLANSLFHKLFKDSLQ